MGSRNLWGTLKVSGGGASELSHPKAEGTGILPHRELPGHSGLPCVLAEPLETALGRGTQVLAGQVGLVSRERVEAKRIWVGDRYRPLRLPVFISTRVFSELSQFVSGTIALFSSSLHYSLS